MRISKASEIFTRDFLIEQHHTLRKTPMDIAREIGCDRLTVVKYMERHKVDYIYRKDTHGRTKSSHARWKGHGDISMTFWRNVKNSGRTRGIPVEVSIEEAWNLFLKQNRRCALSGKEIGFFACNSNSASLDRIDSSKGYSIKNVQWVHKDVNYAKQSLSNDDFVELCRSVVSHADEKPPVG